MEREIQSAKLYVKCPCCPRALQTRELRGIVGDELHMQLVRRIAEAEQAHVDADAVRPRNTFEACSQRVDRVSLFGFAGGAGTEAGPAPLPGVLHHHREERR